MTTVPVPRTYVAAEVLDATIMNGNGGPSAIGNFLLSPPRCFVDQTTGVVTTTAVATLITFDTEVYDTDTMHSTASNTSRIVATTTGLYSITARISYPANATGVRYAEVRKNAAGASGGGTSINVARQFTASGVVTTFVSISMDVQLTAGDYLELFGTQTSGGNLTTTPGASQTFFQARWVASS